MASKPTSPLKNLILILAFAGSSTLLWTEPLRASMFPAESVAQLGAIGTQWAGTTGDSDNDGIPDEIDVDDDNDTITDDQEGLADTDNDGIPNCLDLDSDNDGITDLLEALGGDGLLLLLDADQDGLMDVGVRVGENGLADIVETESESAISIVPVGDLDGDGIADYQDLDTENDGIPDVIEAGSSDTDTDGRYDFFRDLNGDGLADRLTSLPIQIRDTDGDTVPDYRDLDSDQDGINDLLETSGIDTDSDGRVDNFIDNDFDGLDDSYASQSPGLPDTDQDGFPDFRDTDSDGDGVLDSEEASSGSVPSEPITPETPFNPRPVEPPVTLVTGESGSVLGCSVATIGSSHSSKDTSLLTLLVLVITGSALRNRLRARK